MLRSNLPLWFGLTTALLIILDVQYVEMQMTKLHMGILETRQEYLDVETMEEVQLGPSSCETDSECVQLIHCSYALCAMRHMVLTEEFLYAQLAEKETVDPRYDHLLFDTEAASMLATVQSLPIRSPVFDDVLWTLWFYTDKVHSLLEATRKGQVIDPLRTNNVMLEVHQKVVESLRTFVTTNMEKFQVVKTKLRDITRENVFKYIDRMETVSSNKMLLKKQMTFNEAYGVSADGILPISFNSITHLDKVRKIKIIAVGYFGEPYWINVEKALEQMYDTATELDITISHRIICLWHIKHSIMKMLKIILKNFIESYFDFKSKERNADIIKTMDQIMTKKLSDFCECVGENELFTRNSRKRNFIQEFYSEIKKNIDLINPYCTNFTENQTENFTYYYNYLLSSTITSTQTQEWTNIDGFLGKVVDLFSDVNMIFAKSFYSYPNFSQSFEELKEIEHPNVV